MDLKLIESLVERDKTSKIVYLVMDGVGGLPMEAGGPTELEAAHTPNLDALAAQSICGLHEPIAPGVIGGSGPSHLGIFGYDPLKYQVGRGVLSALGIDFDLRKEDVAARGNFCTVDAEGRVTDRRAGRIPSEKNQELLSLLCSKLDIPGVEVFMDTVKEYRFLLVLRGEGLSGALNETDPLEEGKKPIRPDAVEDTPEAKRTAEIVREFVRQVGEILADEQPANMVLLRGFSKLPDWPSMERAFGLKAAAIAMYPMYRGVSKLIGMHAFPASHSVEEEFDLLEEQWDNYDFFFVHIKRTDSAGEDGDFDRKVSLIEEVDTFVPRIRDLKPDVIVVTGDHSTPAKMKYHSWHPVPTLIWSEICRPDHVKVFGERACIGGGLGPRIPATHLMPIALANARRLGKYGA
ncbi:MAG: 2,3-bisphosphoglycerate-independent phosphoglycerate mutase [Anaerolineae bacterium]